MINDCWYNIMIMVFVVVCVCCLGGKWKVEKSRSKKNDLEFEFCRTITTHNNDNTMEHHTTATIVPTNHPLTTINLTWILPDLR